MFINGFDAITIWLRHYNCIAIACNIADLDSYTMCRMRAAYICNNKSYASYGTKGITIYTNLHGIYIYMYKTNSNLCSVQDIFDWFRARTQFPFICDHLCLWVLCVLLVPHNNNNNTMETYISLSLLLLFVVAVVSLCASNRIEWRFIYFWSNERRRSTTECNVLTCSPEPQTIRHIETIAPYILSILRSSIGENNKNGATKQQHRVWKEKEQQRKELQYDMKTGDDNMHFWSYACCMYAAVAAIAAICMRAKYYRNVGGRHIDAL